MGIQLYVHLTPYLAIPKYKTKISEIEEIVGVDTFFYRYDDDYIYCLPNHYLKEKKEITRETDFGAYKIESWNIDRAIEEFKEKYGRILNDILYPKFGKNNVGPYYGIVHYMY